MKLDGPLFKACLWDDVAVRRVPGKDNKFCSARCEAAYLAWNAEPGRSKVGAKKGITTGITDANEPVEHGAPVGFTALVLHEEARGEFPVDEFWRSEVLLHIDELSAWEEAYLQRTHDVRNYLTPRPTPEQAAGHDHSHS